MKPLLNKGVRIIYGNAQFGITDYDFFDSSNSYIINVSDRKDPLEFKLSEIPEFLDSIKRKDGVTIPKFSQDGTVLESKQRKKKQPVTTIDEEEPEEIPTEPEMDIEEEPKIVQNTPPVRPDSSSI